LYLGGISSVGRAELEGFVQTVFRSQLQDSAPVACQCLINSLEKRISSHPKLAKTQTWQVDEARFAPGRTARRRTTSNEHGIPANKHVTLRWQA
jgi:hypothetical protein